jgi:predicted negative regulator of RcsB-dependent stress response
MKKIIVLILLVIAGYFAYQYFLNSSQSNPADEDEISFNDTSYSDEDMVTIPDNCQEAEKSFENAIYGSDAGNVSFAQRNSANRRFQSCLKNAGLRDDQVDLAVKQVQTKVNNYIKQDYSGGQ